MRLIRVFPRKTKATPDDELAYYGPPDLFAEADEVHIDVTFTADKPKAECLAMVGIGFTPHAMLWQPETPSAEKHRPAPEWKAFQRQWARPAIIHARVA